MNLTRLASKRKIAAFAIAALFCLGALTEMSSVIAETTHDQDGVLLAQNEGLIKWEVTLSDALKRAKKEKKLVLVDVYTDWCGWCKVLDKKTYGNKQAADYINKSFVCLKSNAEKGDGINVARKFKVNQFPSTVVLNASGKKIGKFSGFLAPDKFVGKLQDITQSAK